MSSFATGRRALFARLCWVARLETAPTGFGPLNSQLTRELEARLCWVARLETAPTRIGQECLSLRVCVGLRGWKPRLRGSAHRRPLWLRNLEARLC